MTEVLSEHTLMTVDELVELLETTEDLGEIPFEFGPGYDVSVELRKVDGIDKVMLQIGQMEFPLAGDSGEHLFKKAGLTSDLLNDYPPDLTIPLLNWYLNEHTGSAKALVVDNKVTALVKETTAIYSQVDILEAILRQLKDSFGVEEVRVHNAHHDINMTQYTLMFPQHHTQLDNGDVLMHGVFVQNSVIGKEPLKISGVTARDYHHNAQISESQVAQWDRRKDRVADLAETASGKSDVEDVYSWAAESAKNFYSHASDDFNRVKQLVGASAGSHSGTVLGHLMDKYSIPAKLRGLVHEHYIEEDGQTFYNLWNSISMAANDPETEEKPKNVRKLMMVAGAFSAHPAVCKACLRPTDDLHD